MTALTRFAISSVQNTTLFIATRSGSTVAVVSLVAKWRKQVVCLKLTSRSMHHLLDRCLEFLLALTAGAEFERSWIVVLDIPQNVSIFDPSR